MAQPRARDGFSDYLTVGEASSLLGISPWTLRNWDKQGKLTPTRHPKNGYRIYRREELHAVLESVKTSGTNFSPAPAADWRAMGETDHFVQFYENDEFLVDAVSGYMGAALAGGEAGIVIATAAHRRELEKVLTARGLDVARILADGRLVLLDAEETLSKFMIAGRPDPKLFRQVVGGAIEKIVSRFPRLRAFGEMVSLLWADNHSDAAIQVEELWNDLAKTHPFALFCAYPLQGFADAKAAAAFGDICKRHSHVIPGESYAGLTNPAARLREVTRLQQKARSLEAEIAHRAAVEKALAMREQELSDFIENAVEGLHQVAGDGTILWANQAELELLGYTQDEYVGHNVVEFHVDRQVIDGMLAALLRGEALHDFSSQLRCKNGAVKDVMISSNAYFEDGEFIHTRCFTRDVTERVQAEQNNARLAAIVDTSDDAIIGKTLGGIITSWNSGAQRIFGYTAAEAIGRSLAFLIPPDRQHEEPAILAKLALGEHVDHYETQRRTKDGRIIDISLTISPIRDSRGKIIGASKIARDITERKRLDNELLQAKATLELQVAQRTALVQDQAERLRELVARATLAEQRERRKLAALLHDELAQSLALGKLKLTMLEAELRGGGHDEAVTSIKETLGGAIQFTRSLMNDLSPPTLYDMGFSAAIQELAGRMKQQFGLEVAVRTEGDVKLPEDRRAFMFQAVREMLTNVVKYGSTPRAEVSIVRAADHISVTVEDRGAGFDLATLPSVPSQNRGFGLFNLREQVKLLGGSLEIESQPGQGTKCRLRLPLATPASNAPAGSETAKTPGKTPIRVAIVDDHDAVRESLATLLGAAPDIEVVGQAQDGPQALELARRLRPDVLLLDVSLPGVSGVEVARQIRSETPEVTVIGLSMYGEAEARKMCEAGATVFINKACDLATLTAAIREHGGRKRTS